jgi:hypothetical protein
MAIKCVVENSKRNYTEDGNGNEHARMTLDEVGASHARIQGSRRRITTFCARICR